MIPLLLADYWVAYLQCNEHRADVDGEVEDGDDHADDEVGLQTLVLLAHVQIGVKDGEIEQLKCNRLVAHDSPQRP